jgi:D-aminoacyl-tRNA deacylase
VKVLLQRVSSSSVKVRDEVVGSIGRGLLLFVGFAKGDNSKLLTPMADKVVNLRIFPDERGRFDQSLLELGLEILLVSQFTLHADTSKGRRPDFFGSLEPAQAAILFDEFAAALRVSGSANVSTGIFGEHMLVSLENDGPVTIMLES